MEKTELEKAMDTLALLTMQELDEVLDYARSLKDQRPAAVV